MSWRSTVARGIARLGVATLVLLAGCGDLSALLDAALRRPPGPGPDPDSTASPSPANLDCYVRREVPARIFHVRPRPTGGAGLELEAWLQLEAPVMQLDEPLAGTFRADVNESARAITISGLVRRTEPRPGSNCVYPAGMMMPRAASVSIPLSAGPGNWLVRAAAANLLLEAPQRAPAGDEPPPPPARAEFPFMLHEASGQVEPAPSVPFRTLLESVHSVYDHDASRAEQVVIRSKGDHDAFLSRHPDRNVAIPEPAYATEQGVLILLEPQSTGAIRLQIAAIEEREDRLVVHAFRILPPAEGAFTTDVGYPLHYVAIPRTDKPVEFAPVLDLTRTP